MNKNKTESSFSFLDFIVKLASECFSAGGSATTPYDVKFTNHYNSLYDFENRFDRGAENLQKVYVDNKTKSIKACYDGMALSKEELNNVQEYCDSNNITVELKKNKLQSVTINKTSKGVIDDRNWKKELK